MLLILAWICWVAAVIALGIGLYAVISGRPPLRFGKMKQIANGMPARLIGIDLILWSAWLAYVGWGADQLRRNSLLPPRLLSIHILVTPVFIAILIGLQRYALWLSRRRGASAQPA